MYNFTGSHLRAVTDADDDDDDDDDADNDNAGRHSTVLGRPIAKKWTKMEQQLVNDTAD